MNQTIKEQILQKIKDSDKIFIFRHIRPDGDCIGAAKGLKEIIQTTWGSKDVRILAPDSSDHLAFLGPDDDPVEAEDYRDALGIVLDTASAQRISNPDYPLCRELIKIDHHIPVESYGNIQWVEENRSSCCEMIVDFYNTYAHTLKITAKGAEALYTGMVTDSGRFRYSDVSGDTLRNAGTLLDLGVKTDRLFANLYLEPVENLKFKAKVYEKMQITENGVAYIVVDRAMQREFGLTFEQASNAVSMLDSIKGCICWIAFIEGVDGDNSIRVRIRSRFVTINSLAERYRGGGHACASGATVYSLEEAKTLLAEADVLVKEYKENNTGWL